MSTETQDPPVLVMTRDLAAPPERVFDAWTDPDVVVRWWGGWPDGAAPAMQTDPRPGGRYRWAMQFDGQPAWCVGTYTEVERPHRLAFTWSWESTDGSESPQTPVVIELEPIPGGTRLTLTHDLSTAANACAEGWGWVLGCLQEMLAQ